MSALVPFLTTAKRHVEREKALEWAVHAVAAASGGVLAALLASRLWPTDPAWVPPVVLGLLGVAVGLVGWARARPSLPQVAEIVDRRLGGRERLATALELAAASDGVALRQRADAESWVVSVDAQTIPRSRVPKRALLVALVSATLATALAFAPNGALDRLQAERADEAARQEAASEVERLAAEATESEAGTDARRGSLVTQLRTAAQALRSAPSNEAAVASLTRAQTGLRALAQRAGSGSREAAAAAGAELSRSSSSSEAGAALSAAGSSAGEELEALAAGLADASPQDQAAAANELSRAAGAAPSGVGAALAEAAAALDAGQTENAARSLADAAKRVDAANSEAAAAELAQLADSLPGLAAEAQAELARALEAAAAAATADPVLGQALGDAAAALSQGRTGAAASALRSAAAGAGALSAQSKLGAAAAAAEQSLEDTKAGLLGPAGAGSSSDPKGCGGSGGAAGAGEAPAIGLGPSEAAGQLGPARGPAAAGGCAGTQSPLEGRSSGGGMAGQRGAGTGQSQGQGEGQGGQGQAQGSGGSGSGPGGGADGQARGGRSPGGGARGSLGDRPGAPSEQVYVTGAGGPGRVRTLPKGGTGTGTDAPLVPYENVYAEYRAAALSQADRQIIPERLRGVLRDYFGEDDR